MSNRHAYLIMAHADFAILIELVKALDDERNDLYIHIDQKAQDVPFKDITNCACKAGVHFVDRMRVNWGGFSQIKCVLLLMRSAAEKDHYDYYHFLTGQTYPLKDQNYIHSFFDQRKGKEFIGFDNTKDYSDRVRYIHLFSEIGKSTTRVKKALFGIRNKFIQLQKKIRYTRPRTKDIEFKKGCAYWSLTDRAVRFLLSKEDEIATIYAHSNCADELFAQTILYNSEFRENIYSIDHQYDSCLRLFKPVHSWSGIHDTNRKENGFTVDDLERLEQTDRLFGLKFCDETGLAVIQELRKRASL